MNVLAIDPGLSCGWAFQRGGSLFSGTWDLKGNRFEGAGMRFLRLRKYLEDVPRPDALYYEEVHRHQGTAAAHVYGGMIATIQAFCEERGIPYAGVPVASVKIAATGKGNSGKDLITAAARKRWPGQGVVTADQADALWVLVAAMGGGE